MARTNLRKRNTAAPRGLCEAPKSKAPKPVVDRTNTTMTDDLDVILEHSMSLDEGYNPYPLGANLSNAPGPLRNTSSKFREDMDKLLARKKNPAREYSIALAVWFIKGQEGDAPKSSDFGVKFGSTGDTYNRVSSLVKKHNLAESVDESNINTARRMWKSDPRAETAIRYAQMIDRTGSSDRIKNSMILNTVAALKKHSKELEGYGIVKIEHDANSRYEVLLKRGAGTQADIGAVIIYATVPDAQDIVHMWNDPKSLPADKNPEGFVHVMPWQSSRRYDVSAARHVDKILTRELRGRHHVDLEEGSNAGKKSKWGSTGKLAMRKKSMAKTSGQHDEPNDDYQYGEDKRTNYGAMLKKLKGRAKVSYNKTAANLGERATGKADAARKKLRQQGYKVVPNEKQVYRHPKTGKAFRIGQNGVVKAVKKFYKKPQSLKKSATESMIEGIDDELAKFKRMLLVDPDNIEVKERYRNLLTRAGKEDKAVFPFPRKEPMAAPSVSDEHLLDSFVRHLEYAKDGNYGPSSRNLYRQHQLIQNNMLKKLKKGIYDRAKARKGWSYFVDEVAKYYVGDSFRELRGMQYMSLSMRDVSMYFPPKVRRYGASLVADWFEEAFEDGDLSEAVSLGKSQGEAVVEAKSLSDFPPEQRNMVIGKEKIPFGTKVEVYNSIGDKVVGTVWRDYRLSKNPNRRGMGLWLKDERRRNVTGIKVLHIFPKVESVNLAGLHHNAVGEGAFDKIKDPKIRKWAETEWNGSFAGYHNSQDSFEDMLKGEYEMSKSLGKEPNSVANAAKARRDAKRAARRARRQKKEGMDEATTSQLRAVIRGIMKSGGAASLKELTGRGFGNPASHKTVARKASIEAIEKGYVEFNDGKYQATADGLEYYEQN